MAAPRTRRSTLRITGMNGETWEGEGEGMALAARDLGRKYQSGRDAYDRVLHAIGQLVEAQADIEAGHPSDCSGCLSCQTTLPLIRRLIAASQLTDALPQEGGWVLTPKGEAIVRQLAHVAEGA